MDDYRLIADEIAAAITEGRLRPGEQLPTQRALARRRGIAASTAGRVYKELALRGLTTGEVGRGTFVRADQRAPGPHVPLAEPAGAPVDLELNYPVVPEQALLGTGLAPMLRADALDAALRPVGAAGTAAARHAFAELASGLHGSPSWQASPEDVLFAGNGRQAIAGALSALVPPGGRLGVEALTYPVVKAVAQRLGVTLVPLAVDEHGVRTGAVTAAHRTAPLSAVYFQPRLQNPLGGSLPPARRAALADELSRLGLPVVEDAIWSFLRPDLTPFAALLPGRTILVDSVSKRLAPGLTAGFAVVPGAFRDRVGAALRSGGWTPSGFALEAVVRWVGDGTVAAVEAAKRSDATARQRIAREVLAGQHLRADPCSYYVWWELSAAWRAETFVAAAARHSIAITPAAAFAVDPRVSLSAVRVGLASPSATALTHALETLARIARSTPEDLLE